ncbi:MAG: flagellar export chaperone FliS [Spirochaetaceae bacterium]
MGYNPNPVNAYKQTRIKTASQGQIIVMLYDEALRQIDAAQAGLESGTRRLDHIHNAICKAQDIFTELMTSLDFDAGGEVAQNLFSLYMYFNRQLMEANMKKDVSYLAEVRPLVESLREAWEEVARSFGDQRAGGGSRQGLNISG